jgi:hypothetical protein
MEKQLNNKELNNKENEIINKFYSSENQNKKYIETKPFVEFLIECIKNQKPPKNLDDYKFQELNRQHSLKT